MTIHNDLPRSRDPLEPEERELLDAMESGELRSVATPALASLRVLHRYPCGELKDEQRA